LQVKFAEVYKRPCNYDCVYQNPDASHNFPSEVLNE
jgi:hypothetical protein